MKKTESYFIATIGVVLILIRVTYYVLALGFERKIDALPDVSNNLVFFFLIYITFKYISLVRKGNGSKSNL